MSGRGGPARWLRERTRAQQAALLLSLVWLLSGLYVVGPDQVAVVRAFGAVTHRAVPPGIGWRLPWPLGRVQRVRLHQPRQVTVGATASSALVGREGGADEEHLTGDQNLVRIRATVQYTIRDPASYLFRAPQVEAVVAAVVQSQLTAEVARTAVDLLMTTGREVVRGNVLRAAQATLDRYGVGVGIDVLSLEQIRPPAEVAAAFNDVNSAKQDATRKINEATGYANEVVPQARGQAAEQHEQAVAYRTRVVDEAKGQASRFRDVATEYRRAPGVTRVRMHLETVESVAPRVKTVVVDPAGGRRPIDLGVIEGTPPPAAAPGAGR